MGNTHAGQGKAGAKARANKASKGSTDDQTTEIQHKQDHIRSDQDSSSQKESKAEGNEIEDTRNPPLKAGSIRKLKKSSIAPAEGAELLSAAAIDDPEINQQSLVESPNDQEMEQKGTKTDVEKNDTDLSNAKSQEATYASDEDAFEGFMSAYVDRPGQTHEELRIQDLNQILNQPIALVLQHLLSDENESMQTSTKLLTKDRFNEARQKAQKLRTQEEVVQFIFELLVRRFAKANDNDDHATFEFDFKAAEKLILNGDPLNKEDNVKDEANEAVSEDQPLSNKLKSLLSDKDAFMQHFQDIEV